MPDAHAAAAITVMAAGTALLRFLPFAVFGGRRTPALVARLGRLLPCAIMGMLVVYCLKDVEFSSAAGFLPQLIAGDAWRRSAPKRRTRCWPSSPGRRCTWCWCRRCFDRMPTQRLCLWNPRFFEKNRVKRKLPPAFALSKCRRRVYCTSCSRWRNSSE